MGLRNYFQWFIESNVLRTRRWHIQQVVKRFVTPSRDLSSFWPNFRKFLNNRKTIILEVCPHPKLVTHQFICFDSAELTIHMFCKDKIAEFIIAASKKEKPPRLTVTSPQLATSLQRLRSSVPIKLTWRKSTVVWRELKLSVTEL